MSRKIKSFFQTHKASFVLEGGTFGVCISEVFYPRWSPSELYKVLNASQSASDTNGPLKPAKYINYASPADANDKFLQGTKSDIKRDHISSLELIAQFRHYGLCLPDSRKKIVLERILRDVVEATDGGLGLKVPQEMKAHEQALRAAAVEKAARITMESKSVLKSVDEEEEVGEPIPEWEGRYDVVVDDGPVIQGVGLEAYALGPTPTEYWISFDFVDIHGVMRVPGLPPPRVFQKSFFSWRAISREEIVTFKKKVIKAELCDSRNYGVIKFGPEGNLKISLESRSGFFNREVSLKKLPFSNPYLGPQGATDRQKLVEELMAEWASMSP